MSKKELSQYPPDKWIREVNRRYPNLWTDLRKVYENPSKMIRPNSGGIELLQSVPDWCIMPTFFPFLVITDKYGELFYMTHMDELMTLGSTYIWRCSKGIYRFAPEIYQALISQPLTGDLPMECLHHLPEWAVYVETPGLSYERHPMEGFIAHLDYNLFSRSTDLQFAMFLKGREEPRMVALPFGDGSLLDAMERVDQLDNMFTDDIHRVRYVGTRDEYKATFTTMLQLLFYLCSDEPDIPEIEHPQKRRTLSGGVRAPGEPRVWDVGVRISNVIRRYRNGSTGYQRDENAEPGTHASPRPHVRSAHWHTFWTGPRQAQFPERKPIVKWIPPIPIGDVGGRVGFEDAVTNAVSHICELLKTDLCLLIWKACIDTGSDTNTLKSLKNAAYKAYKLVPKDKYFQNISEEATNAITQMRSYAIAHTITERHLKNVKTDDLGQYLFDGIKLLNDMCLADKGVKPFDGMLMLQIKLGSEGGFRWLLERGGTKKQNNYKVITLCGSTRFKDAFMEAQKRLTLKGNIVISVGLFGHSGDDEVWTEGTKEMLDDMHKRKIDMADEIFVINVGGYIGSSTRSEIEYAKATGKPVNYLEEE